MSNIENAIEVKRIKTGGRKLGTPNKRTAILKEMGVESYRDLFETLLSCWVDLLNHENEQIRILALKELSKYVFTDMRPKARELFNEGKDFLNDL